MTRNDEIIFLLEDYLQGMERIQIYLKHEIGEIKFNDKTKQDLNMTYNMTRTRLDSLYDILEKIKN